MSDIPGERKRANQSQPVRTANVHASSVWHARLVGLDWSRTSSSSPPPQVAVLGTSSGIPNRNDCSFMTFCPFWGIFCFLGEWTNLDRKQKRAWHWDFVIGIRPPLFTPYYCATSRPLQQKTSLGYYKFGKSVSAMAFMRNRSMHSTRSFDYWCECYYHAVPP